MSINAPSLNYIFLNNLKSPKENTNYSDGFVYVGCIQQICDEQRRADLMNQKVIRICQKDKKRNASVTSEFFYDLNVQTSLTYLSPQYQIIKNNSVEMLLVSLCPKKVT